MAKIVSFRKNVLLPFLETPLRAGQCTVIQSAQARGRLLVLGILVGDEARPLTRIQMCDTEQRELTSGQFVVAELAERLQMGERLSKDQQYEIVVQATKDCLFVGALKCAQLWDE